MRKISRASRVAVMALALIMASAMVGAVFVHAPFAYAGDGVGEAQGTSGASNAAASGTSQSDKGGSQGANGQTVNPQNAGGSSSQSANRSQAVKQAVKQAVNLDAVDPNRLGSLTLDFADPQSGAAIPGLHARIYRIARMEQNFPATAEFEAILDAVGWKSFALPRATHSYTSSEWDAMAHTINGYVIQRGIPATASATSAQSGVATFADIPVGLYLVVVDAMLASNEIRNGAGSETIRYSFTPAIVAIPSQAAGGDLDYSVVAEPKLEKMPLGENVHYKVVKQWNDGGHRASRPHGITVDIYRDGELVQSVNLNDANNWSYEWSGVQARHEWSAVEHISDRRYTVSNQVQGTSIIITNTLPDAPPERLKETGSSLWYWWLAPLLLSGGLILIALGRGRRAASVGRGE